MKHVARLNLETIEKGMLFDADVDGKKVRMDNGPGSVAASPMQVVLASLGGCSGMDVISILRKMRQKVTGYEIVMHAERTDEHPKVFTAIEMVHRVTGEDLNPSMIERAIELSETRYCSVYAMLAPTVRFTSRYEIIPARSAAA